MMSVLFDDNIPRAFLQKNAARQDTIRRRLVGLIFIIYWMLIFEGALRKWGVPQLEQLFFFIRLPVTFVLYWSALFYRRWPRLNPTTIGYYLLCLAGTILIPIQIAIGGYSPQYLLIAIYGWMSYFFYIPLAFIIAEQFRAADIEKLIRQTVFMAVLAVPVVILQFSSPASSVINLGSGLEESQQFKNLGAALGFVRPTGFFTSAVGQAYFVASAAALLLATFMQQPKNRALGRVPLWLGVGAVMVMTALGQNRSLFLMMGLVLIAAVFAAILSRRRAVAVRTIFGPAMLMSAAAFLWPALFPTAFEVFTARWLTAWNSETEIFQFGILGRAFYGFYAFIYNMADTPLQGYLIGIGGNAARQLDWVRMPLAAMEWRGYGAWVEDGWSRHIVELGPPLGLYFIGFRAFLTGWLGSKAIEATRRSGNVLPLVIFGFVGIVILNGQITGNGTINGYAWMFLGFGLAAAKVATTRGGSRAGENDRGRGSVGC